MPKPRKNIGKEAKLQATLDAYKMENARLELEIRATHSRLAQRDAQLAEARLALGHEKVRSNHVRQAILSAAHALQTAGMVVAYDVAQAVVKATYPVA